VRALNSLERHQPRDAATISEVEGAREQIDAHFGALTKQARDAAALQGVVLGTAIRQGTKCPPFSSAPESAAPTCSCWARKGTAACSIASPGAPR
jgi:hypothetical protein